MFNMLIIWLFWHIMKLIIHLYLHRVTYLWKGLRLYPFCSDPSLIRNYVAEDSWIYNRSQICYSPFFVRSNKTRISIRIIYYLLNQLTCKRILKSRNASWNLFFNYTWSLPAAHVPSLLNVPEHPIEQLFSGLLFKSLSTIVKSWWRHGWQQWPDIGKTCSRKISRRDKRR